jgi:hypothetical protein
MDVGAAGRMAVRADPAGVTFNVWQAHDRNGAPLVNEPGTWNWSNVNTSHWSVISRFSTPPRWCGRRNRLAARLSRSRWMFRTGGSLSFVIHKVPPSSRLAAFVVGAPSRRT